jgi:hypothetical protein
MTRTLALWALVLMKPDGFQVTDDAGKALDFVQGGKTVARYMYAFDAQRLPETYKPYLHVFDPEGQAPITKGPGGLFPHHRGIFIGWNKITVDGKNYDRWHMTGGQQVHQKFLGQTADLDHAEATSLVHWNGEAGTPIVQEERRFTVRRAPAPFYAMIDVRSTLKAPVGDVELGGDPEHAGVHFRPANELDTTKTLYVFPRENANAHKDTDTPWVGLTYTLDGKSYSVVEMSARTNPKGARWSAYRDYGRFGEFFTAKIRSGESLTISHRFAVAQGEMPPAETIQRIYNEFTQTADPAPRISVVPAERSAPAKK